MFQQSHTVLSMHLNYTVSAGKELLSFALAIMFLTGHHCFKGFKGLNDFISTRSMKSSLIIRNTY